MAEVGADHAQEVDFFGRLGVGHDDDAAVAAGVADEGEADAGVAGGALDDGAAFAQGAALFGVDDDGEARAVFYGAARVHELGFAEDGASGRFRGSAQLDQRRVADRLTQVVLPGGPVVEGGHSVLM